MKIIYELTYEYYQYNSGMSDNGNYKKVLNFSQEQYENSVKLYKEILSSIDNTLEEEREKNLKNDLIFYDGYFLKAQLIEAICIERIIK